jgi:hypothetical protein
VNKIEIQHIPIYRLENLEISIGSITDSVPDSRMSIAELPETKLLLMVLSGKSSFLILNNLNQIKENLWQLV